MPATAACIIPDLSSTGEPTPSLELALLPLLVLLTLPVSLGTRHTEPTRLERSASLW